MSYKDLTPAEATMFRAVFACEDIPSPTLRDLNNFLSGKEVALVPDRASVMMKFREYITAMNETHSSIQRRISLVMKTLGVECETDIQNVTRTLLSGTTVTADKDGQEFHIPEAPENVVFESVTFGSIFVGICSEEIELINYVFSTSTFSILKPNIYASTPDVDSVVWRRFRQLCRRTMEAINRPNVSGDNVCFHIKLSGTKYRVWFESCSPADIKDFVLRIVS